MPASTPTSGESTKAEASEVSPSAAQTGTYELLVSRLNAAASRLGERASSLNEERLEFFGSSEMKVLGSERMRTANNSVPRDIVAVGDLLLFGFNVFVGLKTHTSVSDVLTLHRLVESDGTFSFSDVPSEDPLNFLVDPVFVRDFDELHAYYKDARLLDLRVTGGKLLAAFQTGQSALDLRVFRWAVSPDGAVTYIDSRGERDYAFPPRFDFEWTLAGRDDYVGGRFPYVNVVDEVFVDPRRGSLKLKVEDGSPEGRVVLEEPVAEAEQDLADCDVAYAVRGTLVLLRIRPYQESLDRFYVYDTRSRAALRIDAVGQACQTLPEDHGVIFPGGFYLQDGQTKTFELDTRDMEFETSVRSPNGEDVLYVFHHRAEGRYVLLSYNLIRKEVLNPVVCHGFSLFDDGTLVVFREDPAGPSRVHPMQVWATPYVSDEHAAAQPVTDSFFSKVGNADLVRGISDALSLRRLATRTEPSAQSYEDVVAAATRMLDSYHWFSLPEADLAAATSDVRATAELVLDEFEKVELLRSEAAAALQAVEVELREATTDLTGELRSAEEHTRGLARLRRLEGRIVTLQDVRYVDLSRLAALRSETTGAFSSLATRTVAFLSAPGALAPFRARSQDLAAQAEVIKKVADAVPLAESLDEVQVELDLLAEVVSGLELTDATVRTSILEEVSSVLGSLNRARALLENRRRELLSSESVAAFAAEFALFNQAVAGGLAQASTPERTDELLAKLMVGLENLESSFGEFDEYMEKISEKRSEVYEAFTSRKQALLDERTRRSARMLDAAQRILDAVKRRGASLASADEVNSFFASDPMVAKVAATARELRSIGDTVKADELEGALKSAREDAARSLRDRTDIFESGGEVIRFGRHRFSVNTSPLELTMAVTGEGMEFLLTGTDFRSPVRDEEFLQTRPLWEQHLVSESPELYRAEFLATTLLASAVAGDGVTLAELETADRTGELLSLVQRFMEPRYDEGYERGVHDHDAALVLSALLRLRSEAGLLRFTPSARALAQLFYASLVEEDAAELALRAASLVSLREAFGTTGALSSLVSEVALLLQGFAASSGSRFGPARPAATYLVEELGRGEVSFVTSEDAALLAKGFEDHLAAAGQAEAFRRALAELERSPAKAASLADAWLSAYVESHPDAAPSVPEVVVSLLVPGLSRYEVRSRSSLLVEGLLGQHPRVGGRSLLVRLDDLLERSEEFRSSRVPQFRSFQRQRGVLLEATRRSMRLEEFKPKVMSSFVRNQLIDQVYLPMIGDNLAKQLGALNDRRTDQMGLLLLVSPPGYGKTTLMEYVADRLGMVFVKVNGPALGHEVTSLDPADAPNATARREVERINFAFELGNNVILYLDDIQHTNPELLQKFISLADGTRRIEGVWEGETRTYDLRGKRFAVCMAGNPYTESGEKFRIPDMLANRADTYNLGDILSGNESLFALSYVENALTSNPTLAPLAGRDPKDVGLLVRMASGDDVSADDLSHPYSAVELEEVLSVVRKLVTVQGLLLKVNEAYIRSASQADEYRTEPPFLLQGSYRNMGKLAAKVVPVMNEEELQTLLTDHYASESQTLTSGAEENLLKLAELRGTLTPEEAARWEEIKSGFVRRRELGDEDDPQARIALAVSQVSSQLGELVRSQRPLVS